MRIEARFSGIDRAKDERLFEKLIQIFPEGNRQVFFHCTINFSDTRCAEILAALEEYGWQPVQRGLLQREFQYLLTLTRYYDEGDYDNCQYLVPNTLKFPSYTATRSHENSLVVEQIEGPRKGRIMFTIQNDIIVDDLLRTDIESTQLIGYKFNPVITTKTRKQQAVYWELTSDIVLPAMSPSTVFINDSAPTLPNRERFYNIYETPYLYPEFHYPHGSFNGVEPFDFAVTSEQVMMKERGTLVASQAFRQLCKRLKIDVYWVPIRFDPPSAE